ncbi:MAG: CBS domain-containing protein [Pirellulaceae bacterium]|nr:CBS domain-containing protein [Pirellulaceae bacterium]
MNSFSGQMKSVSVDQTRGKEADYSRSEERTESQAKVSQRGVRPRGITSVRPDLSVRMAIELMLDVKESTLLVVDNGRLVGTFSERDVLSKVAENFARTAHSTVGQYMSRQPLAVYDDDSPVTVLNAMVAGDVLQLPVLSKTDDALLLVTAEDLFAVFECVEMNP